MLITTLCLSTQDVREQSDSGASPNTELYKKLETKTLYLPQPVPLNGREKSAPYFFIGGEAFPLGENLMQVYPGQHPKGVKRTNFQLQDLQSPQSCRKCIWPRVISFPSAS
jgi:hypothetical protein